LKILEKSEPGPAWTDQFRRVFSQNMHSAVMVGGQLLMAATSEAVALMKENKDPSHPARSRKAISGG
jgi:hypothetical protein